MSHTAVEKSNNDTNRNYFSINIQDPVGEALTTKSSIDEVSHHLIGKSIKVKIPFDLVGSLLLQKVIHQMMSLTLKGLLHDPVLIKCETVWDRRLLLASHHNLKSFKYKLFIQEDLPPYTEPPDVNLTNVIVILQSILAQLVAKV